MLLLTSCNLFGPTVSKGKYSYSSKYGTIYIELLSGSDCVVYFDGCSERQGSYYVDGETISLSGYARDWGESGKNRYWVTYTFHGTEGGTITDRDKFVLKADVVYGNTDKEEICTFIKRN